MKSRESRTAWEWRDHKFQPVIECLQYTTKVAHQKIDPIVVPRSQLTLVGPGRLVVAGGGYSNKTGAVLEVWDGKKRSKLLAMYGVPK